MNAPNRNGHIRLTSIPGGRAPRAFPIRWGAPTAAERGPIIASTTNPADRNVIGAHGGSYSVYRAGDLGPRDEPAQRRT
jgi:hypothetical protein